jgi:hypothetical protein
MNAFEISNTPYLSQRNNKFYKGSSCYSTSMAMVVEYIMSIDGLTKSDIGIPGHIQVEDFITKHSMSKETKAWAKRKWGNWVLSRLKGLRTFALIQDRIFNRLMNPYGYKSTFTKDLTWDNFCDVMERTRLPMSVRGKFPLLLGGGHVCTAIGFNFETDTLVCLDPFGNAHTRYKDHDGEGMRYQVNKWFTNRKGKMFVNIIERT